MNEAILDGINGIAGHSSALDSFARFMANDGIFVLGAILAVLGLLELRRNPRRGIQIGIAAGFAILLTAGFVLVAGHLRTEPRPFVFDHDTLLLSKHAADNAFPSDHASYTAAAGIVGILAWHRWGILVGAFIVLIGLARVFVGVHYPDDILAGWIGGGIAAVVAWFAVATLRARLPARGAASRATSTPV